MKTIRLNGQLKVLKNILKERWALFQQIHNAILSVHPKIMYRVFPLYVVYGLDEENIALIYYRGAMIKDGGLYIGLNLDKPPKNKRFVPASAIKYPGITYGTKLQNTSKITFAIVETIHSIKVK